jgi:hypothetical protein
MGDHDPTVRPCAIRAGIRAAQDILTLAAGLRMPPRIFN